MTKIEFEESKEPLTIIMSIDPVTLERSIDYYKADERDYWVELIQTDFPERFVYSFKNKAAIEQVLAAFK